jgi:hypothetical protein
MESQSSIRFSFYLLIICLLCLFRSRDRLPTPRNYEEPLFPDYFGSFRKLPIVVAEIKSPTAANDMVELDNRRVPCMMKLSLDQLLAANVKNPVVVGLLISGT